MRAPRLVAANHGMRSRAWSCTVRFRGPLPQLEGPKKQGRRCRRDLQPGRQACSRHRPSPAGRSGPSRIGPGRARPDDPLGWRPRPERAGPWCTSCLTLRCAPNRWAETAHRGLSGPLMSPISRGIAVIGLIVQEGSDSPSELALCVVIAGPLRCKQLHIHPSAIPGRSSIATSCLQVQADREHVRDAGLTWFTDR